MKLPALILVTAVAILPATPASAQERVNPPAKEQVEASAQKIKELQKERIATLKKLVDAANILVQIWGGRDSTKRDYYGEASEARLLLLQAELDTAKKEPDRIALYKEAIDALKKYEEGVSNAVQAGQVTEAAVLRIKSQRLELETAILSGAPISPREGLNPPTKEQVEGSAQKIKELRKERIATLKKLVDQVASDFKNAKGSYEKVLEAQLLLLQAELDAAEKEADRIALYQKAIGILKNYEKLAEANLAQGRGTQSDILRIKARRLEVEILLEQAKVKGAKEGK